MWCEHCASVHVASGEACSRCGHVSNTAMHPDDAAHFERRAAQKARMEVNMRTLLDSGDASNLLAKHPRPWRWVVTVHDGLGIQFRDANDAPVLPALIRDEELAADLFVTLGQ